ncbi:MAG: NADH-quinone oxidoreductase subunit C [Nitrospirota bacterium]
MDKQDSKGTEVSVQQREGEEAMNPIVQKIKERFSDAFLGTYEFAGDLTISVKKEKVFDICRLLHDDTEMDFDYIIDICSVDYPEEEERFEVVYHFYSIKNRQRIRIKARVREDACTIDSVCDIWKGANFMEREVYDMMGIRFNNHPDLRRILMTDDFEGYPLRKDFPVKGNGWRDRLDNLSEGY